MLNYDLLPEHIRGAVQRYIEHHIPPGDFLQAVISNNLEESFGRADDININRMSDIINFFHNEASYQCWGSPKKMEEWLRIGLFRKGTQIICVPLHAQDEYDPYCEKGFVTSVSSQGAFCHYWSKYNASELRTKANGELTPFDRLIIRDTYLQGFIDETLQEIEKEGG